MKTRTKIIIGAIALALIGGGIAMGQVFGFGEDFPSKTMTQKEKQVAFLKEHEQEIVDFVKSQNPKVESVQINWDDVRWGQGGHMFKTNYAIHLYGTFNHIENSSWHILVFYDKKDGLIDMATLSQGDQLRIGGELFE